MKKAFFPGLAALLMLAVLSCEIDEQKKEQSYGYITLNVSEASAGGRALDGPIAEAVTNFYEATFQRVSDSDSKIIRATWNYTQRGRIQIDPGTYTVILMAGRIAAGDKILLGVGQATGIGGGGSISTDNPLQVTITAATTDLYFHAYPLMNNINKSASSTFSVPLFGGAVYPRPTITENVLNNEIPVFMLAQGIETTATWSFGLGALPGTAFAPSVPTTEGHHGEPGSGDQISVFGPTILAAFPPDRPRLSYTPFDPVTSLTSLVSASFIGLTAGTPINGTFEMNLTTPNDAGRVQLSLEIPVVAIATSDKPVIWYIRGGLDNMSLDAGVNPSSGEKTGVVGGAILLGF